MSFGDENVELPQFRDRRFKTVLIGFGRARSCGQRRCLCLRTHCRLRQKVDVLKIVAVKRRSKDRVARRFKPDKFQHC